MGFDPVKDVVNKHKRIPMKNEPRVVTAICTWNSFSPDTTLDIIKIVTSKFCGRLVVSSGSLIPATRNKAVKDALEGYPDLTHLLVIDADVCHVTKELVEALIAADKPIISPVSTMRTPPYRPHIQNEDMEPLMNELYKEKIEDRQILQVRGVAFSCVLIKREVLDGICENLEDGGKLWFDLDRPPRQNFFEDVEKKNDELLKAEYKDDEHMIDEAFKAGLKLGLNAHIGSRFHGEDYNFCHRAGRCGFNSYLHTQWYVGHIGECIYTIRDWMDYVYAKKEGNTLIENRILNRGLALSFEPIEQGKEEQKLITNVN